MMALTRDEAISFVSEVLGVPRIIDMLREDRLTFLDKVIGAFHREIPFQNITACAIASGERHLPTWPEIKRDLFNKTGGICYQNHVFLKELLAALGYEVCYVKATVRIPFDHVGMVVRNVTHSGSKHLIEASGYPTFQAIPLDFENMSKVYHTGFLRHQFRKTKDRKVAWYHEARYDPLPFAQCKLSEDGFYKFCEYDIDTPYPFEPFRPDLERSFTEDGYSFVLTTPRATRFVNQELVAIKMGYYLSEDSKRRVKKDKIKNSEQYIKLFSKYFPEIPMKMVIDVTKRYNLFENERDSTNASS